MNETVPFSSFCNPRTIAGRRGIFSIARVSPSTVNSLPLGQGSGAWRQRTKSLGGALQDPYAGNDKYLVNFKVVTLGAGNPPADLKSMRPGLRSQYSTKRERPNLFTSEKNNWSRKTSAGFQIQSECDAPSHRKRQLAAMGVCLRGTSRVPAGCARN